MIAAAPTSRATNSRPSAALGSVDSPRSGSPVKLDRGDRLTRAGSRGQIELLMELAGHGHTDPVGAGGTGPAHHRVGRQLGGRAGRSNPHPRPTAPPDDPSPRAAPSSSCLASGSVDDGSSLTAVRDNQVFPNVAARNLQGLDVTLPDAFDGQRNVVLVAFQRNHQDLVDSWVPWLEKRSATDPGLRFYELPTIGRIWAPVRNFIDGGMASSIREPVILQRTLTVYGDVNRLARPLGIQDRSTISVFLVDQAGTVRWQGTGGFDPDVARDLDKALRASRRRSARSADPGSVPGA